MRSWKSVSRCSRGNRVQRALRVTYESLAIVMGRLDRSIGIYMIVLNDSRVEPDCDANVESQTLNALV
jgi:hypothetical protein